MLNVNPWVVIGFLSSMQIFTIFQIAMAEMELFVRTSYYISVDII